jgi:hypothetical protein
VADPSDLQETRRAWHGLAELVLAGPQYRRSGTIRLRVSPGGFETVAEPWLRVDGTELVAGDTRTAVVGLTFAEVAALAGVDLGAPADLYPDGSGVDPGETVSLSPAALGVLDDAYQRGDAALRAFAPDQTPVLWPEHFDLGTTVDEVNYGVSPGDAVLGEPYAYVGPWQPRTGPFWNASFGAARPMRELADVEAVRRFFTEGRQLAANS